MWNRLGLKVQTEDVIDLGAPRKLRPPVEGARKTRPRTAPQRPNPRLYPGLPRVKPKVRSKVSEKPRTGKARKGKRGAKLHSDSRRGEKRPSGEKRRRRKVWRRGVVPNPRLYRPPPAAPRAPAAAPAAWRPRGAPLSTASSAALRLAEQRPPRASPAPPPAPPPAPSPAHPPAPSPAHPPAPSPAHPPAPSPAHNMDADDATSAPSEFLAEFLSAIMRRQYAEALKYCRLILQYEPHNATARGFYPLLQHKVKMHQKADEELPRGSSSEEATPPYGEVLAQRHAQYKQEMMEQGGDSTEGSDEEGSGASSLSAGSVSSQSSLELDSSEAHALSSLSLSRRTEPSDSASGGRSDSASRSDDDNGNVAGAHLASPDLQNENAPAETRSASSATNLQGEALRRLRARFTCSIK